MAPRVTFILGTQESAVRQVRILMPEHLVAFHTFQLCKYKKNKHNEYSDRVPCVKCIRYDDDDNVL